MPSILTFDTSAEACSVCLNLDGQLFSEVETQPRQHAQRLLPMIQSLLSKHSLGLSELDLIAFGRGPGSFTGLRIASGVAQGLSYGSGVGVMPVSNLQALALRALKQEACERVLVALDARMSELYWALFDRPDPDNEEYFIPQLYGRERVSAPHLVEVPDDKLLFGLGSGFEFVAQMGEKTQSLVSAFNNSVIPLAEDVALLAASLYKSGHPVGDALSAQPVYIRDEVAWKKLPGR